MLAHRRPLRERCSRCQHRSDQSVQSQPKTLPENFQQAVNPNRLRPKFKPDIEQGPERGPTRGRQTFRRDRITMKKMEKKKDLLARLPRASGEFERSHQIEAFRNACKEPKNAQTCQAEGFAYYARRILQVGAMQKLQAKRKRATEHVKYKPRLGRELAGVRRKE